MSKITLLSSDIVNKIAAGEVVERPASVVKELIENALDAHASKIIVEVENGGMAKINVMDNGDGMDAMDLKQSILRHATSKISSLEDLENIASFGFRGEALSSIAAVSIATIKSKTTAATIGHQLSLRGGVVEKNTAVGMPTGTQMLITDLFFNVPARKKFMKSLATEFKNLADVVVHNALMFPQHSFVLSHNKRVVYDLPQNQTREERITALFGEGFMSSLVPVMYDHPHISISGFIGKPHSAVESGARQFLFVNNRPIRDKIISAAVRDAYATLLPPRSYPVFILFLRLPAEMVDVNVHPRKEEVKFVNSRGLFQTIKQMVEYTLQKQSVILTPALRNTENTYQTTNASYPMPTTSRDSYPNPVQVPNTIQPPRIHQQLVENFLQFSQNPTTESTGFVPSPESPVLQLQNLYLVTTTSEGVLILDQHAAHERILYEQFLANFETNLKQDTQPLLVAETFTLTKPEAAIFIEQIEILKNIGFDITCAENVFTIHAIPQLLTEKNIAKILKDIIADILEERPIDEVDSGSKRVIAYLACRSSVMAGDPLLPQFRTYLVETLLKTRNNTTCPHGRPTRVMFTVSALAKMFKRT